MRNVDGVANVTSRGVASAQRIPYINSHDNNAKMLSHTLTLACTHAHSQADAHITIMVQLRYEQERIFKMTMTVTQIPWHIVIILHQTLLIIWCIANYMNVFISWWWQRHKWIKYVLNWNFQWIRCISGNDITTKHSRCYIRQCWYCVHSASIIHEKSVLQISLRKSENDVLTASAQLTIMSHTYSLLSQRGSFRWRRMIHFWILHPFQVLKMTG